MKRVALSLVLSLAPWGFCFAQNGPKGGVTRQVSNGACSINTANVSGGVTVSFSGPACNELSQSAESLLRQLIQLLQSDLDSRRSTAFYPSLTAIGNSSVTAFTDMNADPLTLRGAQTACGFQNAITPVDLTSSMIFPPIGGSADTVTLGSMQGLSGIPITQPNSILAGMDYLPSLGSLSNPISGAQLNGIAGIASEPPAFLTLPGISNGTVTFESLLLTITKTTVGTGPMITSSDYLPPSKMLADLTSGVTDMQGVAGLILSGTSIGSTALGVSSISLPQNFPDLTSGVTAIDAQRPDGSILHSTSPVGTAFDSSLMSPPYPSSLVTGTDYSALPETVSDLTSRFNDVQRPIGSILPGTLAQGLAFDSVSLTFTNSTAMSGGTITGVDYASLARSLSDIESSGHVITGWTITYLATQSR